MGNPIRKGEVMIKMVGGQKMKFGPRRVYVLVNSFTGKVKGVFETMEDAEDTRQRCLTPYAFHVEIYDSRERR